MKTKLAVLICSAITSGYVSAETAVNLSPVVVSGKADKQSGYLHQFQQPTSTGSKLGLTIKETPASVEVLNAEIMQQRGDTTVINAVSRATGIVGGASGHGTVGNYSVRGFSGYPGIDFLQDGIKLNGTIFSKRSLDLSSLDRIEIIRGAASVLNGEGSVGATVNLITKKPSFDHEETEIGFRAGSHDSYRLNFSKAGVAIEDTLAYRIDGVTRQIGSAYDGEQRDLDSLSASVLYQVNPNLQTSLSVEKTRDDGDRDYQGTPLVNGKLSRSVRKINYNNLVDGIDKGDSLWLRHNIEWSPTQHVEVKNQLYYQKTEADIRRLYLATQDPANPDRVNRQGYDSSQQQDLIGNRLDIINHQDLFGYENKFLVGFDISRLTLDREQSTYAGRRISTPMYQPTKLAYSDFFEPGISDYKKPDVDIELKQLGIYLEDQFSLTDRLKLVAGLRHDTYDIDYDFKQGLSSPTGPQQIDKTHNEWSYRAGVVFDLSEATTLYASYASSFESGDASASLLTVSAAQTDLGLTEAEQYEVGLRQAFLDDKAEFTVSLYKITKENMFVRDATGTGLLNVGKQTAKGFELALGIQPIEQIQIDANLAYVDSEYDEFIHGGVDYSGQTPSSVPKYVSNLGVRYMPISNLGIGTWIRHVDSIYTDNIGFTNSVKLPSYTTVDLTLDYTYNHKTTFLVALKNLTDELYATTARRDTQVFLGEARSIEFGINHHF